MSDLAFGAAIPDLVASPTMSPRAEAVFSSRSSLRSCRNAKVARAASPTLRNSLFAICPAVGVARSTRSAARGPALANRGPSFSAPLCPWSPDIPADIQHPVCLIMNEE
jgi:hypothetical protein